MFKENRQANLSVADRDERHIKTCIAQKFSEAALNPQGPFEFPIGRALAERVGYSPQLLNSLPSLLWESFTGVGNPHPWINIQPGEKILDMGCGAGLDLFLYSQSVGTQGKVYGVELSSEMIAKAEKNLKDISVGDSKIFWAAADRISLQDASVDCISINGAFRFFLNKESVLKEAFRLLKDGGRMVMAEIFMSETRPDRERGQSCWLDDYQEIFFEGMLEKKFREGGFRDFQVLKRQPWEGNGARREAIVSGVIEVRKAG